MAEKSTAAQLATEPRSLKVVEPETLIDRVNRIHEAIARRAFEIFESNGGFFGHELENWLKAEREIVHPSHINVTETDGSVNVQAEVPGFNANELEVSFEPRRLTISGRRETSKEEKKKGNVVYKEECSNELLRVVDLPAEVDATKGTAVLKNGILELSIPKGIQRRPPESK